MTDLSTSPTTSSILRILKQVAQDLRIEGRSAARSTMAVVEQLEAGLAAYRPLRVRLQLAEYSAENGATPAVLPGVCREFELEPGETLAPGPAAPKDGCLEIASASLRLEGDVTFESFADVLVEMLVAWWEQRQAGLRLETVQSTLETETEAHRFDLARIATYQKQLRKLAAELALAEDRERREIAAKMHDCLVYELSAIQGQVQRLREDPAMRAYEESLVRTLRLCADALECTKTLSTEISPPVLHEQGLGAALRWLGEQFEIKHGLSVDARVPDFDDVPEELRLFLFQATRELLANVVKHAETRRARVRGHVQSGWIHLEVRDRGCGSSSRSRRESGGDLGFGLFSIRERTSYFGGRFTLESEPGRGTRVQIDLPLDARP